jgi:hypothetical protein
MANIKYFLIFLLEFIYDPFINIICEKKLYHTFKLKFIGKIVIYKKSII